MPIYEYRCKSCGQSYSELVRMGTKPEEVRCPQCDEYQSERLFSAFATSGSTLSTSTSASSAGCGGSGFS